MLIKNGAVITQQGISEKTDILIRDGRIASIGEKIPEHGERVIDAGGLYVSPGFIDIHTHGGGDFMDCKEEAFMAALAFHAENGTTAILATSVTAPVSQTLDMIHYTRPYLSRGDLPCRILGVHLEGPYLSVKNKGAQHESFLRVPARDDYSFILENSDVVRRVTLAPELEGAKRMSRSVRLRRLDIAAETVTNNGANKIRGALDIFPRRCITLGMKQLLSARVFKVYLYCSWQWGNHA